MNRPNMDKFLELIVLFEKHDYLTTDDFKMPDIEYIFLDKSFLNPIRFRRADGPITEFNIAIFNKSIFRPVVRRFENVSHLNDF